MEFSGHEEAIAILERAKVELEKIGFVIELQVKETKRKTVISEGSMLPAPTYHNIKLRLWALNSVKARDHQGNSANAQ
jgi:hypothetical protein